MLATAPPGDRELQPMSLQLVIWVRAAAMRSSGQCPWLPGCLVLLSSKLNEALAGHAATPQAVRTTRMNAHWLISARCPVRLEKMQPQQAPARTRTLTAAESHSERCN